MFVVGRWELVVAPLCTIRTYKEMLTDPRLPDSSFIKLTNTHRQVCTQVCTRAQTGVYTGVYTCTDIFPAVIFD